MTDYISTTYQPPVRLADAYVISQDVSALQAEARAMHYLNATVPVVDVKAHPADYVTMTGLLEAISEGPQMHDGARKGHGRVPVWALVCLWAGLALIGLSLVGLAYLGTL